MYVPLPYQQPDDQYALDLIRNYPFGILTATTKDGLQSVHLPFVLLQLKNKIYLQTHMAKSNRLSNYLTDQEILIHFSGPQSYVSPSWYSHQNHFPTWIYASVHIYGTARKMKHNELSTQLETLINTQEKKLNKANEWKISTMPEVLTEHLKTMIIGFEIQVSRLESCFKLNQHKDSVDMESLALALRTKNKDMSSELAYLMEQQYALGNKENINQYLKKYETK